MNLFSEDHKGMKVSASGILRRNTTDQGVAWARGELLKHMEQAAEEYYKGNITAVDELFQLYCVGEKARKAAKAVAS